MLKWKARCRTVDTQTVQGSLQTIFKDFSGKKHLIFNFKSFFVNASVFKKTLLKKQVRWCEKNMSFVF